MDSSARLLLECEVSKRWSPLSLVSVELVDYTCSFIFDRFKSMAGDARIYKVILKRDQGPSKWIGSPSCIYRHINT